MGIGKIGSRPIVYSPKGFEQFSGKVQMKKKNEPKVMVQVEKDKFETAVKMIEGMGSIEFWKYWAGTLSNPNYKGEKPWDIAREAAKWMRSK